MIPKSGYRFSEKICSNNNLEPDDDSKKSHHALWRLRPLTVAPANPQAVPALKLPGLSTGIMRRGPLECLATAIWRGIEVARADRRIIRLCEGGGRDNRGKSHGRDKLGHDVFSFRGPLNRPTLPYGPLAMPHERSADRAFAHRIRRSGPQRESCVSHFGPEQTMLARRPEIVGRRRRKKVQSSEEVCIRRGRWLPPSSPRTPAPW